MLGRLRNSFAEIDLNALEQNYLVLKSAIPGGLLAPMVKGDGYGHGDIQVSRVCEKMGARFLGVALVEEGIKLRMAGIQTSILVFSHFDAIGAEALIKYRLTPVIGRFEQIAVLKSALHEQASYPVHVKFNTGMNRLGLDPLEASRVAEEFVRESYLKLEGVCTHFASSEDYGTSGGATESQIKCFLKARDEIKKALPTGVLYHYMNSGALLSKLDPALDMARPGIALYGSVPKLRDKFLADAESKLKPVMAVKSFIGFIQKLKRGERVSYGGTWRAEKNSVIAVVPIGYADGIPRALSNKGHVLIQGELCPIVGIVCMDYTMVDVTDLIAKSVNPAVGDEVVVIGKQKNKQIRAEEMAAHAGTISYEIFTGMQARLARVYVH